MAVSLNCERAHQEADEYCQRVKQKLKKDLFSRSRLSRDDNVWLSELSGCTSSSTIERTVKCCDANMAFMACATRSSPTRCTESLLRYAFRDWSREAEPERSVVFNPLVASARDVASTQKVESVLVVGIGCGRLAHMVCESLDSSIAVTALEKDSDRYSLASYALQGSASAAAIYPFLMETCNMITKESRFSPMHLEFPLVRCPVQLVCEGLVQHTPGTPYDLMVSSYIIHTTCRDWRTVVDSAHRLLVRGGKWVLADGHGTQLDAESIGGGGDVLLPTFNEILMYAVHKGFSTRPISQELKATYCQNPNNMYRCVIKTSIWEFTKAYLHDSRLR